MFRRTENNIQKSDIYTGYKFLLKYNKNIRTYNKEREKKDKYRKRREEKNKEKEDKKIKTISMKEHID